MPGSVSEVGALAEEHLSEVKLCPGMRVARREDDGSFCFGTIIQLSGDNLGVSFQGRVAIPMDTGELKACRLTWLLSDLALDEERDISMKLRFALRRDNVVIYDTTHATSRFGLKLGCFVTVGSDMHTKIIAMSLVSCEDKESFEWVFRAFLKAFVFSPSVIFTDGDQAMKAAIASVFPDSAHLLCVYHLSLNLSKHFRGLLGGRFKEFSNRFWKICLETDSSTRGSFDKEWASFTSLAESVRCEGNAQKLDQALKWLKTLGERKEQWVGRWTWAICTYGVRSTQRSEALHAAIKQFLRASGLLTNLLTQLTEYSMQTQQEQRTIEFRRQQRKASSLGVPQIVAELENILTPAAFEVVKEQALLAGVYYIREDAVLENTWRVYFKPEREGEDDMSSTPTTTEDIAFATEVEEGRDHRSQGHLVTLIACSCQFPTMRGLPCRHIIKAHMHSQCARLFFKCAPLWKKTSDSELREKIRSMSLMRMATREKRTTSLIIENIEERRSRLMPIYRQLMDTIRSNDTCDFVEGKLKLLISDVRALNIASSSGSSRNGGVDAIGLSNRVYNDGAPPLILNADIRADKRRKRIPNSGS
jgi:hypothetical protein